MYQKILIVGNLGRDPEMRYTPDGTPVTTFSVATNRKWSGQDGKPGEETVWFRVTAWRRLAETCNQYLQKGRQVLIEGRLHPDKATGAPRIWTGNDGVARSSYEVTAQTVKFLGRAGDAPVATGASGPEEAPAVDEDQIPF
ncbi:MAG: single-stranded DNA-binding protein [Anaerolineales bacterium]|nr:MAG: single-stranded DNA-binding protein [Anaerolineales bacterium]